MKRTTLKRYAPLVARSAMKASTTSLRRTPMKQGRKVKATAAESQRMGMVKQLGCIFCLLNPQLGLLVASTGPCDAHHELSGGRRIGHLATIGGCLWHHRGQPPVAGMGEREAIATYGPSVATGSKPMHAMYGSDAELLEFQNELLAMVREVTDA